MRSGVQIRIRPFCLCTLNDRASGIGQAKSLPTEVERAAGEVPEAIQAGKLPPNCFLQRNAQLMFPTL